MISEILKYQKYIVLTESGLSVKGNTPLNVKEKIIELDNDYKLIYGEHLISFDSRVTE